MLLSAHVLTHASQPHAVLPHLVIAIQPGTLDLVLLMRKGFIKVALEAGAALVPVLCFGENEQYHRVFVPRGGFFDRLQALTEKVGMWRRCFLLDGCTWILFYSLPKRSPRKSSLASPPPCSTEGSRCRWRMDAASWGSRLGHGRRRCH